MVPSVGALILVFLSFLILSTLVNFFHKMWWVPTRVKRIMTRQGIKGPPYHFIHGNTKEIAAMKEQANITRFTEISHDIYPRIQPHFFTWFQLYGWEKLSGLVWSQAELVITEPDIIREIANNHRATFARPDLGSYNKKILGDGLVTSSGKKWASQRKLANHVFNAMVASVELMLNRWKKMDSNEVEMNAEFRMLAAEVISRTAFGSNYLQGKEVFEMLKEMGTIAGRNYYNPRHLGLLG
ncbi:putative cytochrome P450 [Helianthus annuus]|nr:putative cytochrome P450 [Helianthus annuus]KAJ0447486.1 putative cytochrome P450 [Helianthus annuus]KAJ0632347.1 putative cytochrome P450 [Helianthus annuus]KAJ0826264.1 putative cytochrome P450 [Helianthus annuus]